MADDSSIRLKNDGVKTFRLRKKYPSACTGLFWRPDPRPTRPLFSNGHFDMENWPRNGALLRGIVHEVNGKKWLKCVEVKQRRLLRRTTWDSASGASWLPFEYGEYYLKSTESSG
eukprot:CAMPEP_0204854178 /NCGR_PEP_ID=MMETSP1347-20130617/14783_1 /ASSEMBLY_ACC=CAM_ASM_000690 /TAXON_ID=215587 /ORGANISM="Aplanochytrium stocchinoi, Strain GSBS06" /LENGTH=114 /DNA_ID=CAMNT_0051999619 /DNA_START=25 /DNA_END=369 /DNA_ORIENTATION=-